jgi:uncharacterized protein YndB with AHSA1/START domain
MLPVPPENVWAAWTQIEMEPGGAGTRYRATAIHMNAEGARQHADIGFPIARGLQRWIHSFELMSGG